MQGQVGEGAPATGLTWGSIRMLAERIWWDSRTVPQR